MNRLVRLVSIRPDVLVLGLITLLGGLLRFWNADVWPPGLEYDEGLQGLDALNVWQGHFSIYFREAYREPLYVYLASPFVGLLGRTALAVRIPAMIAGTLVIPLTYGFVAELFHDLGRGRSRTIGLLSAGFVAFSFWPIVQSRTAIPGTVLPPIATAALWLFWRAWSRGRGYAVAGLVLGVAPYTYLPSRLLPIVIGLYVAARMALEKSWSVLARQLRGIATTAAVALLVFAPLGVYYLGDPSGLTGRASAVSIFRRDVPEGNAWLAALRTTGQAIGAFFVAGDQNWYHNLPGRPVFDPPAAVAAAIGLSLAIWRFRRPAELLLIIWAAVMLSPGILSDDNNPNTARLVGLIPVAFVFPGLGLEAVINLIWRSRRSAVVAASFVGGAVLVYCGWSTATTLAAWAERPETFAARSGEAVDAAASMTEHSDEPGAFFLLPISNRWPVERHYQQRSLQFLYTGLAPYAFQRIDDLETPGELARVCGGCRRLYVVVWKKGPHVDSDPKGLATFLAARAGALIHDEERQGFGLLGYDLPALPSFADPTLPLANVDFDGRLALGALSVRTTWSGRDVEVVTRWKLSRQSSVDERVSYRLAGADGRVRSQVDRPLLANDHRPTTAWQAGSEVIDRALVPVPPGLLPGVYLLSTVVYGGGAPVERAIASVEVSAPKVPYPADWVDLDAESDFRDGEVRLLGITANDGQLRPGGFVDVVLYWQAIVRPTSERLATVEVVSPNGTVVGSTAGPVTEGLYPATLWEARQLIADERRVAVDLRSPPGRYGVVVRVNGRAVSTAEVDLSPP